MLLPPDSAFRFIEGYKAILLQVLADAGIDQTGDVTKDLVAARSHMNGKPEQIDLAIAHLGKMGQPVDTAVESAARSMNVRRWIYLRHGKMFAVFLDTKAENAFQVRALTTPLNELAGEPPVMFEAGVFEYDGVFVCDGLAANPLFLGPNYTASFRAAYSAIRKAGRVHTRPIT